MIIAQKKYYCNQSSLSALISSQLGKRRKLLSFMGGVFFFPSLFALKSYQGVIYIKPHIISYKSY